MSMQQSRATNRISHMWKFLREIKFTDFAAEHKILILEKSSGLIKETMYST